MVDAPDAAGPEFQLNGCRRRRLVDPRAVSTSSEEKQDKKANGCTANVREEHRFAASGRSADAEGVDVVAG